MPIPSRLNPVGGAQDFWSEFKRPNPYRWPILGASLLSTFTLMYWVTQEQVIGPPTPPQVSFISTFADGRSEAEIIASNLENQRLKDAWEAELAVREAEVRDMYRALGRASGIDVDAMERQIDEDRAREEAEQLRTLEQAGVPTDPQTNTQADSAVDTSTE
ncbi:hypothetical protein A9995_14765 [Erythrobacter sp. QSSC1-22B]|uniref:hypothetical protein n=1 Tax=Erythrobacter sp. QSSC1-22B TaxID=1860125 RepID=UPI00080487C0|nr:hypothetical protein [Erythrobacter sp. QSSC1-22B]OBX17775.1 hypothetical protein A9995_14765 [Erythrobacter sp. QSSC1-22B]